MYFSAQKCAQNVIAHCPVRGRLALAIVPVIASLVPTACAYEGLGVNRYAAFSARGDGTIATATRLHQPPLSPTTRHWHRWVGT
jgi:hypothetical protein